LSYDGSERKITLVIADPSTIVLYGLSRICEADSRMRVAAQSVTLKGVMKAAEMEKPAVALVDWNLVSWGIARQHEELKELRNYCPILFLSLTERIDDHKQALRVGAKGILDKRSSPAQIRKAIWKVANGGIWVDRPIADSLIEHALAPTTSNDAELQRMRRITKREREVMALICKGKRNKEIASEMNITETTVSHHLTSIFGKLQVSDRLELLAFAYRHSLQLGDLHESRPRSATLKRKEVGGGFKISI
jgi:DNA-binding NarL/FixJ family response regulator